MANGISVGNFAQGLSQGLQSAISLTRAKNEADRFELEKPKLEADAEEAKARLAFQKDYGAAMKGLMEQAKGGTITNPDGTVAQVEPMDQSDLGLKASELFKTKMFEHGLLDFDKLEKARAYTKNMQQEGVMEAIRYAQANPSDAEGIRKIFNSKGKMKIGDDIQFELRDGMFGADVVGVRVGKDGQKQEVFNSFDLTLPYLGAEAFANVKARQRTTEVEQAGADRRAALSAGTSLSVAQMQADREDARLRNRAAIDAAKDDSKRLDEYKKTIGTWAGTDLNAMLRSPINQAQPGLLTAAMREVAQVAESILTHPTDTRYRNNPAMAYSIAKDEVFPQYGISTDPLFPKE